MNTPTYDLSGEGLNKDWERDLEMFKRAGFKEAKDGLNEPIVDEDYPWLNPDATLVLKGDSQSAPLNHGIVFLHKGMSGERPPSVEIHTALDANTPQSVIDNINDEMGFFSRPSNSNGPFVGYFQLNREESELATYDLNEFEYAMAKVKALGVDTVNFPVTSNSVEMMPIFGSEKTLPNNLSEEQLFERLSDFVQDQFDVLDVKPEYEKMMLSRVEGFANVREPEYSPDSNHMKMGVKRSF